MTDESIRASKQGAADSGPRGYIAHQQKERDDREALRRQGIERPGLQPIQEGQPARQHDIAASTGEDHGDGDRYADHHQEDHDADEQDANGKTCHSITFAAPAA